MTKAEKEDIKRKLILWYENSGNNEIGDILKRLIMRERKIIEYRYRDGIYWDFISEKMNLSRMQCFRIHNSVIERIYKILSQN